MTGQSARIKDVAVKAQVAVGTVSNALNHPERVSPDTLKRVMAAINELGFVRNDAARQLRAGRSRTIGLIVLDNSNPFFSSLARAAEEKAIEYGSAVIVGNSDHDPAREAHYMDLFEEQRVQGLLLSPVHAAQKQLDTLRGRGVHTVLVDQQANPTYSSVSMDDVEGGYLAVQHLLSLGRRRIAYIGGPLNIIQVRDRLEGAEKAVSEVDGATLEVVSPKQLSVLAGREAGERIVSRPKSKRPDAIFCANDLLAVGAMQSILLAHNYRIPDDIALIGYDDIDFASSTVVPLSSVRQPTALLGSTAIELLMDELESAEHTPRQVVFSPELVVRASTG